MDNFLAFLNVSENGTFQRPLFKKICAKSKIFYENIKNVFIYFKNFSFKKLAFFHFSGLGLLNFLDLASLTHMSLRQGFATLFGSRHPRLIRQQFANTPSLELTPKRTSEPRFGTPIWNHFLQNRGLKLKVTRGPHKTQSKVSRAALDLK